MPHRTQGMGNPNTPLAERSLDELHNLGQEHCIDGYARMNKSRLVAALREAGQWPGQIGDDLAEQTVGELQQQARELEIPDCSGLRRTNS